MANYVLTKERLKYLTIMAYLYFFPGDEGLGGVQAPRDSSGYVTGPWFVGTRLRAPWGPLWDMTKTQRKEALDFLVSKNCLEVDDLNGHLEYNVTDYGAAFLRRIPYRLIDYVSWYKHPTGWSNHTKKYTYADPAIFVSSNMPGANSGTIVNKVYEY